jgi:hypothetical protein
MDTSMIDPKAKDDRPSENLGFLSLGCGWVPLEWVALVKCLDPEGKVRYREMTSKNLQPVEALGMVATFEDTLRTRIMMGAREMGPGE